MPVEKIKKIIKNNSSNCVACDRKLSLGFLGLLTRNDIKFCPKCGTKNKICRK